MSTQITTAFVKQYNANVKFLAQQAKTKFASKVSTGSQSSEKEFFDFVGAAEVVERTTRHADTPLVEVPHARRCVTTRTFDWSDLIDKPDKLKTIIDPQSSYSRAAAMAFNRKKDDLIIEAATGTAYSGKEGTTAINWADQTGRIIVHGSAGLTLAKLLQAREIKASTDLVDEEEEWFLAVSPKQMTNLLNTTEIKNADYNTVKALVKGEVNSFCGFTFVSTNKLGLVSAGVRRCFAWSRSGILLSVLSDVETRIDPRPDKNYSTQVWASMSAGATRMSEELVIEIQCSE